MVGAKIAHDEMLKSLKAQYVKLNSSKLINWIVKRYFATTFEQERQLIIDAHFDNKEYLRNTLAEVSSREDLQKVLQEALQKVKTSGDDPRKACKKRRSGFPLRECHVTMDEKKEFE